MILYGLKACDTCRKALKALTENGKTAELVDIRATPLSDAQIARFLAEFGTARLINTRSTTWRGLSEEARATDPEALLAAHPALMKRPLIEEESGALHLGWTAEVRGALGL